MTGKERVLKAISHSEADRVPIDLGSSIATSINVKAYIALLELLGYKDERIEFSNVLSRLAKVDKKIIRRFSIDTCGIFPKLIFIEDFLQQNDGSSVIDEWGIKWFMPKNSGHYYDMIYHPLENCSIEYFSQYKWVNGTNPDRFTDMELQIKEALLEQNALVLGATIGNGIFQTGNWLEGYYDFLCDVASRSSKAEMIMEKILEIKIAYWETVLNKWGPKLDIVFELDDLGMQSGLLISPETYKTMIKPRQKLLFEFIKKKSPHIKIMFHSDGSIKPLIPHLIETGIDILNPVQISAFDMNPADLKKEFGNDITFWGGGIDTQYTLPKGTPDQIEYEIRKNLEILAPGGGFVFAPVHNIQEEVPPENIIKMFETVLKYGKY
jgi:uroporphyrinogen decarboxylase